MLPVTPHFASLIPTWGDTFAETIMPLASFCPPPFHCSFSILLLCLFIMLEVL